MNSDKNGAVAKAKLGKLKPRYSFILNSYRDERLSKCPMCRKLTYLRKFPLLIHINRWGLMTLGKTCRFCSRCELIMCHQDELEAQLAHSFEKVAPDAIGNAYMVVGTLAKTIWQRGMQGSGYQINEALKHSVDFKQVLELKVEGGWVPDKNRQKMPVQ